ncbi:MAG: hypothetical protein LBM75_04040 [Myxococcales bacterium]|jgi:hypothetical protein|nr:hypothetical protein [Myxococcales bacterium]
MKLGFTQTLVASSLVVLSLNACTNEPPAPAAASKPTAPVALAAPEAAAPESEAPADTKIQIEKELQYDVRPTAAQTAMALTLGYQLMSEGKLEEAEARFKVAAAGGNAEAEKTLSTLRNEIGAKGHLDSARQKFQYGDYDGAKNELRMVPQNSMLRKSADTLQTRITEKETALKKALEDNIQKGLNKALADEGAAPIDE